MLVKKGFEIIKLIETIKRQAATLRKSPQRQPKGIHGDAEFKNADGHDAEPHEGTTSANDKRNDSETASTDNGLIFVLVEKLTQLEQTIQDQKDKA